MTKVLVTGGAGFVGSHLVRALVAEGRDVLVIDDLSRVGSAERLDALLSLPGGRVEAAKIDIVNREAIEEVVANAAPFEALFHLAAQVAVTWSMEDPHRDFLVNALGSFHVIDAVRRYCPLARCFYMSSNKVYGDLADLRLEERGGRWTLPELPFGIAEHRPLDPITPYGVSKASGECAFRDAARTFGLDTFVLRASCIYGPRQSQQEDQGWVAWFAHAVGTNRPFKLFGDGKTTRDLLYVDDLIDLYLRLLVGPSGNGLCLNVGGGPKSARSLLEVVALLEQGSGGRAQFTHEAERPADQKVFVTDIRGAASAVRWEPQVLPEEGLLSLI